MKKESLNIFLVQATLFWKDIESNLVNLEELIAPINYADIILLPEMFNTAFCPEDTYLAENMNGRTVNWMHKISKDKNCSIAGTLMIKEGKDIFNRLVWISKEGTIYTYDKRHLFSLIGEEKYISRGNARILIEQDGWKICPLICYDLRFPVFSRNDIDYDILVYLANWPQKRIDAWQTLLKARSIENQCYTIGVNRTGEDGLGINFNGKSSVFDVSGKEILKSSNSKNKLFQIEIKKDDIMLNREKMNFLKDRDNFKLIDRPL